MTRLSIILLGLAALPGCASMHSSTTPVTPVPAAVQQQDTLLGSAVRFSWSDRAFETARVMVRECLARPHMARFRERHGRLPVIKVVPSLVQTSGSVDPLILEKLVEMELINSGRARVISVADVSSRRRAGEGDVLQVPRRSLSPDFVLSVQLAAQERSADTPGTFVVLTTLQLVHVQTNEKVWMKVLRSRQG